MVLAYNMKVRQAALPGLAELPMPAATACPFCADAEIVARIRREFGWTANA